MAFKVKKYHKKHRNEIGISFKTEAYIQSLLLNKTYISVNRRCDIEEKDSHNQVDELVSKIIETSTEIEPVISQE